MRLVNLTNKQKHIQEKMTFFLECLSFINDNLGVIPIFPFEHPLSLINKICNEIENNPDNRCEYLGFHMQSLTTTFDFFLDKSKQPYSHIYNNLFVPFLTEGRRTGVKKNVIVQAQQAIINNYPNLKEDLMQLEQDIRQHILNDTLKFLHKYIVCNAVAHDHKQEIVKWAHILVSYARLENFSKKEVSDFIERILSSDLEKFQFPSPILEWKNIDPERFQAAAKKHLKRRTLMGQLNGLKNIIEAPKYQTAWYIFPILQTQFKPTIYKEIDITINKVNFVWAFHSRLATLRKRMLDQAKEIKTRKWYSKFFKKSNLMAMVQVSYDRPSTSKTNAYLIVKEELAALNNYFGTDMHVKFDDMLFSNDLSTGILEYSMEWPKAYSVTKEDIQNANDNLYKQLKSIDTETSRALIRNENQFSDSYRFKDPVGLWQYLENIFWYSSVGNNKEIKKCFTKIALNIIPETTQQLRLILGKLLSRQWPGSNLEISEADRMEVVQQLVDQKNDEYDLKNISSTWKRPFLVYMANLLSEINSPSYQKLWETHFSSLINETKSYRNFAQHQGTFNQYSKIKLESSMPSICSRLRWFLIRQAKINNSETHKQFLLTFVPDLK